MFLLSSSRPLLQTLLVLLTIGGIEYAAGFLQNPFRLTKPYKVTPISYQPGLYHSNSGHFYGARHCGGDGRLFEVRSDSCVTGYSAVCSLVTDRNLKLEFVFAPSETANWYFIRPSVTTSDGETLSAEISMPDQRIVANKTYLVTATVQITSELQGKVFTGRTEVVRKSDSKVMSCVEADYYVH